MLIYSMLLLMKLKSERLFSKKSCLKNKQKSYWRYSRNRTVQNRKWLIINMSYRDICTNIKKCKTMCSCNSNRTYVLPWIIASLHKRSTEKNLAAYCDMAFLQRKITYCLLLSHFSHLGSTELEQFALCYKSANLRVTIISQVSLNLLPTGYLHHWMSKNEDWRT